MTLPTWWQFLLLALGAFRVTRLIGWDDLTIPYRRKLTGLGDEEHKQWAYVIDHQREVDYDPWDVREPQYYLGQRAPHDRFQQLRERLRESAGSDSIPPIVAADQPHPPVSQRRYYLSKMVRCPWCLGFWVSLAFGLGWGGSADAWLSGLAIAFPLSAAVGLIAKQLDP